MRLTRVVVSAVVATAVGLTAAVAACSASSPSTGPTTAPGATPPASAVAARPQHQHAALPPAWPGYHGGGAHRGLAKMPRATSPHVSRRVALDGAVYASPIAVDGLVVVATENDTVYALDRHGRVRWHVHLGTPSPAAQRPCGNIDPLGITGTPVYSPRTHRVYVVTETGNGGVRHTLVSIGLRHGKVHWRRSVDLPGRDATAMQQRSALAVDGSRVWVSFGGLAGDCGDYVGRLIGVPLTGHGAAVHYDVPTAREAGMWQPSGPAVDADGHLLVAVGNGAAGSGDPYDHSDSVLKLTRSATLLDYFAPSRWAADNEGDVDLGSVGPALVGRRWIVQGGKSSTVYVLRQAHLGGIGGQAFSADICQVFGGAAVQKSMVFLPCTDGVRAVQVGPRGTLRVRWHLASGASGSPVVGGRRVWVLDPGRGTLDVVRPKTGAITTKLDVGTTSRFATPALYGRLVVVPTMSGVTFVRTR